MERRMERHGKISYNVIAYITFAVLVYALFSDFPGFFGLLKKALGALTPLLFGVGIAFVLNLPLKFLESTVLARLGRKRILSVVLTYLLFFAAIAVIAKVILPTVISSIVTLASSMDGYMAKATDWVSSLSPEYGFLNDIYLSLPSIAQLVVSLRDFLVVSLPGIIAAAVSLTGGLINLVAGIAFSVYLLYSKEYYFRICKRVAFAFLPERAAKSVKSFTGEAISTYEKFVGGQLLEAVILGVLCFIGMSIFRFPYAPIISVLVGVTALIPILGAYIGTIPSALLILFEDPVKALWFVVFIIVLQQLENNLIYPKVVGSAIGISGLFVLIGITVGGNLFGVLGMLLGVPFMALLYTTLSRTAGKRLRDKNIVLPSPYGGER